MRIGIITGEYPPLRGGVGAYSRIMAETLTAQGQDVFVLSARVAREVNPAIRLTNSIGKWRIGSLRMARRWAQNNKLDVVNLQYQTAAFGMSPWIHFIPDYLGDIPFVTTFHDLLFPYLFPKAGQLRDWIVMRLAKASTGTIITNHEDMERLEHLPHSRLIPIGSNILTPLPDNFDRNAWRGKIGVNRKDLVIAHFGFVNRSKGLETLFQALAILRLDSIPVKLMMIGGRMGSSDSTNAAYVTEIDALITERDLTAHIIWTGYVEDEEVTSYLAASDVVVLPFRDGASYRRGSLMAAIQHGCAIVTTQPKVEVPTFRHGENMMLFPADDVAALVATIKQLRDDCNLRAALRTDAQALRQNFDWVSIAQDYVQLFEELVGERA